MYSSIQAKYPLSSHAVSFQQDRPLPGKPYQMKRRKTKTRINFIFVK
jgi:hypothetical protein